MTSGVVPDPLGPRTSFPCSPRLIEVVRCCGWRHLTAKGKASRSRGRPSTYRSPDSAETIAQSCGKRGYRAIDRQDGMRIHVGSSQPGRFECGMPPHASIRIVQATVSGDRGRVRSRSSRAGEMAIRAGVRQASSVGVRARANLLVLMQVRAAGSPVHTSAVGHLPVPAIGDEGWTIPNGYVSAKQQRGLPRRRKEMPHRATSCFSSGPGSPIHRKHRGWPAGAPAAQAPFISYRFAAIPAKDSSMLPRRIACPIRPASAGGEDWPVD
jgi:hypothetical protein